MFDPNAGLFGQVQATGPVALSEIPPFYLALLAVFVVVVFYENATYGGLLVAVIVILMLTKGVKIA